MGCFTKCIANNGKIGNVAGMSKTKFKAVNISLPPEVWAYVEKRAENNGMRIPVSRVISQAISQLAAKERRASK